MKPPFSRRLAASLCATTLFVASGCATADRDPADPFEGFNRAMFAVNDGLDTVAIKPVAQGYEAVTPLPVKVAVGNFFGNIWDSWTAINNLLQGKGSDALSDVGRVLINSTIGIGGAFDVAGEMGLTKHSEEFGQTLGKWGVPNGPYFYWPLIGPRTTRDTFGWLVDTWYDPVWRIDNVPLRNSLVAVRYTDLRASFLPADKVIEEAAFDKYSYIRDAYLQNRRSAIFDGDPPSPFAEDNYDY
ncbi:MAG: VacJ family lipoprotein [Candidatus Accumulibacter sp.]|nr:VacJ family lipoprotein [Accumulibacter sp.]